MKVPNRPILFYSYLNYDGFEPSALPAWILMIHHAYPLKRNECQHKLANNTLTDLSTRHLVDRPQGRRVLVILGSRSKEY